MVEVEKMVKKLLLGVVFEWIGILYEECLSGG